MVNLRVMVATHMCGTSPAADCSSTLPASSCLARCPGGCRPFRPPLHVGLPVVLSRHSTVSGWEYYFFSPQRSFTSTRSSASPCAKLTVKRGQVPVRLRHRRALWGLSRVDQSADWQDDSRAP